MLAELCAVTIHTGKHRFQNAEANAVSSSDFALPPPRELLPSESFISHRIIVQHWLPPQTDCAAVSAPSIDVYINRRETTLNITTTISTSSILRYFVSARCFVTLLFCAQKCSNARTGVAVAIALGA